MNAKIDSLNAENLNLAIKNKINMEKQNISNTTYRENIRNKVNETIFATRSSSVF